MTKRLVIEILILLVLAATAAISTALYINQRSERRRVESNFEAIGSEIEYYKTQSGQMAARTDALQLHYSELKQLFPEIMAELKNLQIPPHRVDNYSQTVIHQDKEIVTKLRDSLLYDTVPVRVFNYQDEFYKVSGIAIADSQRVHIQSTDSLIQVVYRGERNKPWLWIFSRRKLQQSILSKNPSSKIIYSRQIQITK